MESSENPFWQLTVAGSKRKRKVLPAASEPPAASSPKGCKAAGKARAAVAQESSPCVLFETKISKAAVVPTAGMLRLTDLNDDNCIRILAMLTWKDRARMASVGRSLRRIVQEFDSRRPWALLRDGQCCKPDRGNGEPRVEVMASQYTGPAGSGENLMRRHLWLLVYVVNEDAGGELSGRDEVRVYDLDADAVLVASVVLASRARDEDEDEDEDEGGSCPTRMRPLAGLLRPAPVVDGVFSCVASTPGGYWAARFGAAGDQEFGAPEILEIAVKEHEIVDSFDESEAVLEVLPYRSPDSSSLDGWFMRRTGKYSSASPHLFFRKDGSRAQEYSHCELSRGPLTHRFDPFGADEDDYYFDGVETKYLSVGGLILAHPIGDGRLGIVSKRRNGFAPLGNRKRNEVMPQAILLHDDEGIEWLVVGEGRARRGVYVNWLSHLEAWTPKSLGTSSAKPTFKIEIGHMLRKKTGIEISPDTPSHLVLASPCLAIVTKDGVPVSMVRIRSRGFVIIDLDIGHHVQAPLCSLARRDELLKVLRDDLRVACYQRDSHVHCWAIWGTGALHWKLDSAADSPAAAVDPVVRRIVYDERAAPFRETCFWNPEAAMSLAADEHADTVLTLSSINVFDWGATEFAGLIQMQ